MEDEAEASSGRKRKVEAEWKRNVVRVSRVKELEYIDYRGRTVLAVTTGPQCG